MIALIVFGARVSKGCKDFDVNIEGDYLHKQTDENGDSIFPLILPSVLSAFTADLKDEVMVSVDNIINHLLSIAALSRDQKKTISTIGTLLRDSIENQFVNAQEKRALELDLQGIADLEVKPFLSTGPVTEVLTRLRDKTMMVG